MPVMECTRDGQAGYKWGDGGYCYLVSEEGSDADAKKKALAQGIAIGDIDVSEQSKELEKFASLKRVEIMRPGTHNGIPFDDERISLIEQETNEALPYLLSQVGKQAYDNNPDIELHGKPIPGAMNLNHQEDMPKSFIQIVKDASFKVYTDVEDGVKKLFAEFENIPDDVAQYVSEKYKNRSIELMPPFFNPLLNKVQRWAIRSVGFLDDTMPPAVEGMNPNFVVEFARRNEVSVIRCANMNPIAQGDSAMDKDVKTPMTAGSTEPTPVDVKKEPNSEILEMKAQLKKLQDDMAKEQEARKQADERAKAAELRTHEQEIDMFMQELTHKGVSVAAQAGVKEALLKLSKDPVLKFSQDGKEVEQSPLEFWKGYVQKFGERVPNKEQAPGGEEPTSILEMQRQHLELKREEVRKNNPNMKEDLVRAKAYDLAIAEAPQLYN